MIVMNVDKFIEKLNKALNSKTLYVKGCFGSPLTKANKKRYIAHNPYNAKPERQTMINEASEDTYGFDCVCLIKGILWGWDAKVKQTYGGAKYGANAVPDASADGLVRYLKDVSSDFTDIIPGEVVYMPGHVGVYVGEGKVIECSPRWKNCVQLTYLGNFRGYKINNYRIWTKHGKLPYIDYMNKVTDIPIQTPLSNIVAEERGLEVENGSQYYTVVKGDTLSKISTQYNVTIDDIITNNKESYPKITKSYIVVGWKLLIKKGSDLKSNEEIAKEVIAGCWGTGATRKKKLTQAGYDYDKVQAIVNKKLSR